MPYSIIKSAATLTKFIKDCKTFESTLKNVKVLKFGDGKCVAELKIDESHTNAFGGLHGGFSTTLVDCFSTCASFSKTNIPPSVSVNINMSFLKTAKIGDEIIIDAKAVKVGKSIAFLEVEIRNKLTNEIIAKGTHTKYFIK